MSATTAALSSALRRVLMGALLSAGLVGTAQAEWMPHIHQYWFEPSAPTVNDSLTIVFFGTFPYDCGEIADVATPGPSHLEFTMRPGPACPDTVRSFTRPILLGAYPQGLHTLHVRERVEWPSGPAQVYEDSLEFLIAGAGGPPPPPPPPAGGPPADSLEAVMSASRPNPFVTETYFGVSLDAPAQGRVMVYDLNGRRVATLFQGILPRGTTQFTWDGRRPDGDPMPEGIYFYRLTLPDRVITRRVVLLGNLQRR